MELIVEKYKQTEVGLIPSDWDIFQLDELATKIGSGITPTGGSTVYKEDGRPFIRSQNIGWGNLLLDDIAFIDDEIHQTFPNTEIKFKDVFLNISGASIGRSSCANEKLVGGNVNQHVCIIRVIDKKLHPIYLNLFLLSNIGQKQIDSFQSGGNRQGLNIGQIKTFQISVPPTIEEQTAIATALSDADALISGLEKLIAKKRNIKQGAMQKLLQPKEGWEMKKLGEIAELITKGTTPTSLGKDFQTSGINFIKIESLTSTGEIIPDKVAYIDESTHQLLKRSQLKFADILFSIAGALGRVAIVEYEILPANTNQALAIIRLNLNSEIDLKYLFIYLTSIKIQTHILNVSVQGAQANLSLLNISQLLIEVPKSKEEQTRISTILSDMDAEINNIETKLEKYRKVKLGMMQNLLTGKIRFV